MRRSIGATLILVGLVLAALAVTIGWGLAAVVGPVCIVGGWSMTKPPGGEPRAA